MEPEIKQDNWRGKTRTACVAFPHGCPRSKVDAATVVDYLKANGWSVTTRFDEASLVLVSTCGGDGFAEEKSMVMLSIAYRKKRKDAQMVVFGCLPGINGHRISERFDVTTLTPGTLEKLDEITGADVKLSEIKQPHILSEYDKQFQCCYSGIERTYTRVLLARKFVNMAAMRLLNSRGPARLSYGYGNIYELKVVQGCLGKCTYCAIRFGEGELASKPMDEVLEEFRTGIAAGYKSFRLIGGDVGAYGQDTGTDIPELLRGIFSLRGDWKLMWDDFGPEWLIKYFPELSEIFSTNAGNIGYLGFPTQTGSDRILRLMNRNYSVDEVKNCLGSLKQSIPGINLTSHIIVGFPGEKKEDFSMTLDFMDDIKFRQIEVFKYSDRPNTEASRMEDKVPETVKTMRLWQMRFKAPDTCVVG